VRALVKELLNYLALTSGDVEFKADLTDKVRFVASSCTFGLIQDCPTRS
jgi:hypothetical protein